MEQQVPRHASFAHHGPAAGRIKQDHVAGHKFVLRAIVVERGGAAQREHRAVVFQPVKSCVPRGALDLGNVACPVERLEAMDIQRTKPADEGARLDADRSGSMRSSD
jgi:hypothetical protein